MEKALGQFLNPLQLLITGACGFVGSSLATELAATGRHIIIGLDNLCRSGSEINRQRLQSLGIRLIHGDIRCPSDFEPLPAVDWVLDAAANPSVLAGTDGRTSSRQLLEHNLVGTLHLAEYCKKTGAGLIILSTSRVYSVTALAQLPLKTEGLRFAPDLSSPTQLPEGCTSRGIAENFSTSPPLSLYGTSKLASELLALEYGETFGFPVHINRCGVLAGAGQFGKPDQGIFSYWLHSWAQKQPLRYIGFKGTGFQVRDCLHPRDLLPLLERQMNTRSVTRPVNISGGVANSLSLAELSAWCEARWGPRKVQSDLSSRRFDVPWLILDSSCAREQWQWQPRTSLQSILEEIAAHAESHPHWLELSR